MEKDRTIVWNNISNTAKQVFYNTTSINRDLPLSTSVAFADEQTAAKIMAASDPRDQKMFGAQVNPFRGDVWNKISTEFMQKGLELKVVYFS